MRSGAARAASAPMTIRSGGAEPCSRQEAVLMKARGTATKRPDNMMRILTIAGALAAATLLGGWTWGFDRQGPFCLYDRDYTNCGYPSFAACLASASGAGGYCAENPRFVAERAQPRRRKLSGIHR